MKKMFIGFLLIFLNFNLKFGANQQYVLNLIPDFIGYLYLVHGIREMENNSNRFAGVKGFTKAMVGFSAILYAFNLFGGSYSYSTLNTVLGLIETASMLYIMYCVIKGILEIEIKYDLDINGENLYSLWKTMIAVNVLSVILSVGIPFLVTVFSIFTVFGVICLLSVIVVHLVIYILFLVRFYRAWKLYEIKKFNIKELYMNEGN